jgi:hypothetical protein
VNFELFCAKAVERPESSVEQEFAAKKHKKREKRNAWRSAYGCAVPAGQASNWWRTRLMVLNAGISSLDFFGEF